ncbi:MAG: hypothetical protein GAK30_03614 [Paracidovorax wautersii]|uniref:HTH cro/C1-type domain-containing protein n=1 Tax=Paracidovorax wautersii TaxID=1177982 RepID=A0A7V8JNZ8_9BURK|nr:MAG: hypothetical protein GAK30_03614 [Paracidovorax wautersii]
MTRQEINASTIEASLQTLGERLARLRLSRNLTQARLARESGASVSSIKRLEAGDNTSLDTLLRVLGVLGLEDRLLQALPDPSVRPIERVRHGGRERQRAREQAETPKATDWAWGEEGDA